MPKRQLTEREKYLQQYLPDIQEDKNPLDEEIREAIHQKKKYEEQLQETKRQLSSLQVVRKPKKPKPTVKDTAALFFSLTGVVVVALFLFHCIIWVLKLIFDISWNTWGWTVHAFFWGIGISVVSTIIAYIYDKYAADNYVKQKGLYDVYVSNRDKLTAKRDREQGFFDTLSRQVENFWSERCEILRFGFNHELGLPCPSNAISIENYSSVKRFYLTLLKEQKLIPHVQDGKNTLQRQMMDEKLKFLYDVSLKAEVNPTVYKEFQNQIKQSRTNVDALRSEVPVSNSQGFSLLQKLPTYKMLLNDDKLTPIINHFEAVRNRDTSAFLFFTDTGKETQQTRDMKHLVDNAKQEYDELQMINSKLSYALDFVRGCAYRNIYLGVELINYVRTSHGGGSLEKQQDSTEISNIDSNDLSFDTTDIDVNISDQVFSSLLNLGDSVLDDRDMTEFVFKNPKVSIGLAAVAAIGSAVDAYFTKRAANADLQNHLADAISKIADGYTEGKGQMLRVIEIIKAIVKANDGFMAIYRPLAKKVFEDGDVNLSKAEQTQLGAAINEYKKVSETKIR